MPGVEIKIADKGEILVKSPGMLKEYYKSPEATAETITPDGYFKTGDAGFFDNDGHLKIIDRSKDVGTLTDGTMFAPQFLENKLKFFPFIKEAVCFGDGCDMVCAFLNIEMQAVGNWAERNGLPYAGYVDLAGKAEVYALIQECVDRVNEDLAQEASLSGSQIRRFLVLHKELDADDDELTRTRKVRRNFVAEKYAPLVSALFNGADHCEIETQVKFEDGRSGTISADVTIRDVALVAPGEQKKAA
jgi:long-chain acyl-CoA synthetase